MYWVFHLYFRTLPEEDFNALNNMHHGRTSTGDFFITPEGPYKTMDDLWDGDNE